MIYNKPTSSIGFETRDLNAVLVVLIIFSLVLFFKVLSVYGKVPIIAIISGNENIAFINQLQASSGGGIFGLFSLLISSLIILLPYSYFRKEMTLNNKLIFIIHFSLLFIYTTYSGKRQMMFICFSYFISYLIIVSYKIKDFEQIKKVKKLLFAGGAVIVLIFLLVGIIRAGGADENQSVIDPVNHYLSLPFMNLSNIILMQDTNNNAFTVSAFFESIFSSIPNFFKSSLLADAASLKMPLIEKTSPSSLFGLAFWNFSYVGVFILTLIIGYWSQYLYYKAFFNPYPKYIGLYSLTIWPLFTVHTYNHFINFTFYIFPVLMILIGNYIYKALPQRRNHNAS